MEALALLYAEEIRKLKRALAQGFHVAVCLLFLVSVTSANAQAAQGSRSTPSAQDAKKSKAANNAKRSDKSARPVQQTRKAKPTQGARNVRNASNAKSSKGDQKSAQGNPVTPAARSAAVSPAGPGTGTQAEAAARSEYQLGPGDAIRVMVYQNPDLTVEARVSERGSISFPLIGVVNVGKLSIGQAEQRIASELRSRKMLKAPHVNIVLLQVRGNQVSVLGEVHRPGRFALDTVNVRVSDMLAAAGGVTPTGDDLLVLSGTRNGRPYRKTIDVPALFARARSPDDVLLQGGDTLYVHKAPVFYIYGEAQRPGPYRIERGMTVMQALALGGGPTPRGNQDRLRLTRKLPDGLVVQTDPLLTDRVEPGDVLLVRESFF